MSLDLDDRHHGAFGYFSGLADKNEGMADHGWTFYYHPKTELRKVKKYIPINGVWHPASFEWIFEEVDIIEESKRKGSKYDDSE